jgi:hypothetical protein
MKLQNIFDDDGRRIEEEESFFLQRSASKRKPRNDTLYGNKLRELPTSL